MSSTDHVGGRLFVLDERFNSVCLRTLSCGRATFLLSIIHLGICGRGRAPLSSPSSGLLALLLRPSLDALGQIARIRQSKPPWSMPLRMSTRTARRIRSYRDVRARA